MSVRLQQVVKRMALIAAFLDQTFAEPSVLEIARQKHSKNTNPAPNQAKEHFHPMNSYSPR